MLLRFGRTIRENMSAVAGAAREIQLCGPSSGENDDTTRSASIYEHGAWKNGRFPRSIYGLASNRHCGPMQLGEPPCTDTQAWCGFRDELKGKASPFYSIGPCRPPISRCRGATASFYRGGGDGGFLDYRPAWSERPTARRQHHRPERRQEDHSPAGNLPRLRHRPQPHHPSPRAARHGSACMLIRERSRPAGKQHSTSLSSKRLTGNRATACGGGAACHVIGITSTYKERISAASAPPCGRMG
jgi:hypothetical protein